MSAWHVVITRFPVSGLLASNSFSNSSKRSSSGASFTVNHEDSVPSRCTDCFIRNNPKGSWIVNQLDRKTTMQPVKMVLKKNERKFARLKNVNVPTRENLLGVQQNPGRMDLCHHHHLFESYWHFSRPTCFRTVREFRGLCIFDLGSKQSNWQHSLIAWKLFPKHHGTTFRTEACAPLHSMAFHCTWKHEESEENNMGFSEQLLSRDHRSGPVKVSSI